jgi:chain length determinant protein (polysaccharide antigen chain regulator)
LDNAVGNEIDLRDVLSRLWRGKLTILATTALAALIGAGAYYASPNVYQSESTIYPITQSEYAGYIDLLARSALPDLNTVDSETDPVLGSAFPYTRDSLFQEFTTYLQSPGHLILAAQESGVARDEGQKDTSEAAALAFARTVRFTPATDKKPSFEMRVRGSDREAVNKFVAWSLENAGLEVAKTIREATMGKIAAGAKIRGDAIAKLRVEIDARRNQQEKARKDEAIMVAEQAKIAETLGIKDPVTVPSSVAPGQSFTVPSTQVISGEQPMYLQGSRALEEQINLLNTRSDNDPFITQLRDLERQIYQLENNKDSERLTQLLNESPLSDPATAPIADYSVIGASAEKVFPNISIFLGGAVLLGLLLGSMIVLLRVDRSRSTTDSSV